MFVVMDVSCNKISEKTYNYYPEDSSISTIDGIPNDSLLFYFPDLIKKDSVNIEAGLDTFMLNWYSSALYCAKESILYNYYLGHDVYRFLWLRSFHRPVIFSLHKEKNKVWLTTKILDRQPQFLDETYVHFSPPIIDGEEADYETLDREQVVDSIVKADRKANLILSQAKQLSAKEWEEFEFLLNTCSFWDMKPYEENHGLDGSEWIIEGHLKNKYWFVCRWSPKDGIKTVGIYLIEKSGIKEEIY